MFGLSFVVCVKVFVLLEDDGGVVIGVVCGVDGVLWGSVVLFGVGDRFSGLCGVLMGCLKLLCV